MRLPLLAVILASLPAFALGASATVVDCKKVVVFDEQTATLKPSPLSITIQQNNKQTTLITDLGKENERREEIDKIEDLRAAQIEDLQSVVKVLAPKVDAKLIVSAKSYALAPSPGSPFQSSFYVLRDVTDRVVLDVFSIRGILATCAK